MPGLGMTSGDRSHRTAAGQYFGMATKCSSLHIRVAHSRAVHQSSSLTSRVHYSDFITVRVHYSELTAMKNTTIFPMLKRFTVNLFSLLDIQSLLSTARSVQ